VEVVGVDGRRAHCGDRLTGREVEVVTCPRYSEIVRGGPDSPGPAIRVTDIHP